MTKCWYCSCVASLFTWRLFPIRQMPVHAFTNIEFWMHNAGLARIWFGKWLWLCCGDDNWITNNHCCCTSILTIIYSCWAPCKEKRPPAVFTNWIFMWIQQETRPQTDNYSTEIKGMSYAKNTSNFSLCIHLTLPNNVSSYVFAHMKTVSSQVIASSCIYKYWILNA